MAVSGIPFRIRATATLYTTTRRGCPAVKSALMIVADAALAVAAVVSLVMFVAACLAA